MRWRDAEEGERRSRARFAQNIIKPEEVAPEWKRWRELLGDSDEVRRFTDRAMSRLNAPLEITNSVFRPHFSIFTAALQHVQHDGPPPPAALQQAVLVTRSHPLPATLAEALLEGALDSSAHDKLGRVGAWATPAVKVMTMVALLRLRFKLTIHGRREKVLLVEEANALGLGPKDAPIISGETARALLEAPAASNLAYSARDRLLAQARERVAAAQLAAIKEYVGRRAEALAHDHSRVRAAGVNVSRVSVEAVLPADVVGLFVLIPGGV